MTFDSGELKLYVNGGVEYSTTGASINSGRSSDPIRIFCGAAVIPDRLLEAYASDIRLYDTALSAAMIARIYSGESISQVPKLWYKCDDTHSILAYDSSGDGLHGTKTGITPATFHVAADDAPKSFQNEVGYTPAHEQFTRDFDALNVKIGMTGPKLFDAYTEKVTDTTLNNYHQFTTKSVLASTSGVAFAISVYAKLIEDVTPRFVMLVPINTGVRFASGYPGFVLFDLTTGTTTQQSGATGTITSVGGGWYRLTATATPSTTGSTVAGIRLSHIGTGAAPSPSNTQYAGTGTSGVYVCGFTYAIGAAAPRFLPSVLGGVPRDESAPHLDALGGALQYKGRVPRVAQFKSSYCATFDGINDWGSAPRLIETPVGALSITGWFKSSVSSGVLMMMGQFSGTLNRSFASYLIDGGVGFHTAADGGTVNRKIEETLDLSFADGEWHHYTGVFNGNDRLRVYVDGVARNTDSVSNSSFTTVFNSTGLLELGSHTAGTVGLYSGSLADFRAYFTALSDDDVLALYEGRTIAAVPVAHYPLAEGQGPVAYDISGGGRHLALANTTPASFWGATQDKVHHNICKGFTKRGQNFVTYSQNFENVVWNNSGAGPIATVSANATTAPDGTLTADRLTFTAHESPSYQSRRQHTSLGVTFTQGTHYTASCYVKADSVLPRVSLGLDLGNPTRWDVSYPTTSVEFDTLATFAQPNTTVGVEVLDDGWLRLWIACRCKSTFAACMPGVYISGIPDLTGSSFAWGFQINEGIGPTPYLPTQGVVLSGQPLVPGADGVRDAIGLPIENPAGSWHNGAETELDFTAGVATPYSAAYTLPTDYAFSDGGSGDLDVETSAKKDSNFIVGK
jgi:hypothetical protein